MKKLFSIFFVLDLIWSGNVWAQEADIIVPNRAPQATQAYYYCFFEEPTYLRIDQQNNNSSSVFKVRFGSASGAIGRFDYVTLFSATDIRGTFSFNSNKVSTSSNYNYTIAQKVSGYYYAEPMYGNITLQYTGSTSGDGYPIYSVTLAGVVDSYTPAYGSKSKLYANWSGNLPVRFYNNSGNLTTLKNQTTITAQANNASYGTVSGGGNYNTIGQNVTLTATANSGYVFSSWADNGSTNPSRTITIGNADATYVANFRVPSAGIITGSASPAAGGSVEVSPSGSQAGGAAVTLTVTPNDGYIFTQWSDGNTDNPRTVYVDGNATYTAQFVQGVAINADNSVLYVWNNSEEPIESGAGAYFDFVCSDGTYTVQIESASVGFSTTTFSGAQLEQTSNYTFLQRNGSNIALDYSQTSITFTANTEQYSKRHLYDVTATLVATNGTRYVITGKAIRAMDWDSDSDYRDDFPKNDYNFAAPTYTTSIPEYKNGSWSYNAGSKWLTADVTISNFIYRIRLAFNVSPNYIPTGVYTLATGNGSLLSNYATPAYSYDTSVGWASEIDGSHVFQYGTGQDDNSYWWYLETGTISVVNTNGIYYVEVDALNSRGLPVRFTMGTPPAVAYTLGWNANGGELSGSYTAAGSVNEGASITAPTATRTGYTFTGWSPAFTGTMPAANTTYVAQWELNTYTVTFKVHDNSTGFGTLQKNSETPTTEIVFTGVPHNTAKPSSAGGNALSFQNSTITPIPAEAAGGYTYAFQGWNDATSKITSDKTISARFTRTATVYSITYNNYDISTYPGTVTTTYTVESSDITLLFAPNVAKEGYTFDGWYANEELTGDPVTTIPAGSTGNKEFWAKWEANTYAITYNAGANGTGTIAAGEKTYNEDFTLSSSTFTRTGYTQTGWSTTDGGAKAYDLGETYTGNTALNLYPYWEINTYDITFKNADGTTLKKSDGTTDAVYSVAYGETPVYDGATPTKAADSEYTYTFNAWTPAIATVTTAATYTATYSTTKVQYTLTWDVNGGNELTGTYTNGTMDWGTAITAPADPTKAGYTFGGWDANDDGTADDVAATMPTSDVTYKALWNAISSDLVLKDGVTTGQTDINFDEFAATYNGQTMSSVTLNRTFTAGNWATICLPFYVDESQLSSTGLFRKVYEFRYATGSADADSSVTFHFRVATSMEAGRGYLVKGESGMDSSFVFNNVTINTSADTKADVNDLKGVNAYYDESVGSDIAIVGVLRSGTLSNDDRKVMGLANNKIWYPHSSGNPMPAYRAYFYNPNASASSVMPRVRIVVEGEGTTELEVVDGELYDASNGFDAGGDRQAYRAPSKYIRNGVLIIERNGVRYDAQGKRL